MNCLTSSILFLNIFFCSENPYNCIELLLKNYNKKIDLMIMNVTCFFSDDT